MADYTRDKRKAGLLPMYERQASEYYNKNKKTGLHEDIKDGYIGSTAKMDGMGELVDTLENEQGGFYGEGKGEKTYIYKKPEEKQQSAPAPAPVAAPEPVAEEAPVNKTPSKTLQDAMNTVQAKKGRDFSFGTSDRDAERRALTDSFSQKSYDPEAGIASEEAGDFLDNYKLNLGKKLNLNTEEFNPNPNGGE